MKTIIHVNQHAIRRNIKAAQPEPVLTVKNYKSNNYAFEVEITGPARIIYSPHKPCHAGPGFGSRQKMKFISSIAEKNLRNRKTFKKTEESIMSKALITAALDIEELAYTLRNVAQDDKCEPQDLKDALVIKEAKYVLGLFTDPAEGHMNGEDYRGENGEDQKTWAKAQVKQLRAFLKKHEKTSQSTPRRSP